MANDLTFTQTAAIMNDILAQTTGAEQMAPINTDEFVNVAQTALKTGYDRVMDALSQTMTKTLFASRPYTGKFGSIQVTEEAYGNHIRKVNYLANKFEDNMARPLENLEPSDPMGLYEDTNSIDQWKIRKPKAIQTNFYGGETYSTHITRFKNQLDVAFSDAGEAARFFAGVFQELDNDIEQLNEGKRKMCIANLIATLYTLDAQDYRKESVVHLLTEYNTVTGQELTKAQLMQATNYKAFMQWVLTRMDAIAKRMGERSYMYHTNLTGFESRFIAEDEGLIPRFTPLNRMKTYIFDEYKTALDMRVKADTHHPNFLTMATNEGVISFQSLATPDEISVVPSWTAPDGTIQTGAADSDLEGTGEAVAVDDIFGIFIDEDAAGMAIVDKWTMSTPMNANGGYMNTFWHWTDKFYNDNTENAVLFLLD